MKRCYPPGATLGHRYRLGRWYCGTCTAITTNDPLPSVTHGHRRSDRQGHYYDSFHMSHIPKASRIDKSVSRKQTLYNPSAVKRDGTRQVWCVCVWCHNRQMHAQVQRTYSSTTTPDLVSTQLMKTELLAVTSTVPLFGTTPNQSISQANHAQANQSLLQFAIVCLSKLWQTLANSDLLRQTMPETASLLNFARVCLSLLKFARVCYSLIKQTLANFSKPWQSLANYSQLFLSWFAQENQSLLKFARVCLSKLQQTIANYGKLKQTLANLSKLWQSLANWHGLPRQSRVC